MKKIMKSCACALSFLSVLTLNSIYATAQYAVKDTLPESAYNLQVPKRVVNIYSNFVPYVLFGIVLLGMAYIAYRYWSDNRPDHNDLTNHHLEH